MTTSRPRDDVARIPDDRRGGEDRALSRADDPPHDRARRVARRPCAWCERRARRVPHPAARPRPLAVHRRRRRLRQRGTMTVAASTDPRKPRVELRRRRSNGTISTTPTVRWTDADGMRRRRKFDTSKKPTSNGACLALELTQTGHHRRGQGQHLGRALAGLPRRCRRATRDGHHHQLRPLLGQTPRAPLRRHADGRDHTPLGRPMARRHARQGHRPRDGPPGDGLVTGHVHARSRMGRSRAQSGQRRTQTASGRIRAIEVLDPAPSNASAAPCSPTATTSRPRSSASSPTPASDPARASAWSAATSARTPSWSSKPCPTAR